MAHRIRIGRDTPTEGLPGRPAPGRESADGEVVGAATREDEEPVRMRDGPAVRGRVPPECLPTRPCATGEALVVDTGVPAGDEDVDAGGVAHANRIRGRVTPERREPAEVPCGSPL